MKFHEKLNEYISELGCTGKDISNHSGLSASSLSRYRSGERVSTVDSEAFSNLCIAIEYIASAKGMTGFSSDKVTEGNSPAIHFVIHHPKLRNAIENFVPPVVE